VRTLGWRALSCPYPFKPCGTPWRKGGLIGVSRRFRQRVLRGPSLRLVSGSILEVRVRVAAGGSEPQNLSVGTFPASRVVLVPSELARGVRTVSTHWPSDWAVPRPDWPGLPMFPRDPSVCKAWNHVRVPPRAQHTPSSEGVFALTCVHSGWSGPSDTGRGVCLAPRFACLIVGGRGCRVLAGDRPLALNWGYEFLSWFVW
jgi:hypothetical protein